MILILNLKRLFYLFALTIFVGCSSQIEQGKISKHVKGTENSYPPTIFPKDTTSLWMSEGSSVADTVLIIGEGGPHNALNFEWEGKTIWSELPNFKSYYRAHILQSTMFNKQIYENTKGFTVEQGELEADNCTEILNRAVRYFKQRNKVVLVIGSSFSSWIILDHIVKANVLADSYIISAGRLKSDEIMVQYHALGFNITFEEDAETIRLPDTTYRNPIRTKRYFRLRQVKNRIKAAFGRRNYMELLANKDLSNVTFVYGVDDWRIGKLTEEELKFLESKHVAVFATQGGHGGSNSYIVRQFNEGKMAFRMNKH